MAAISKFLFDTEFGGADPARPARSKPEPRNFTAADIEAAKTTAYEAGLAAGRSAAEQQISRRIADAIDIVAQRLGGLLAESASQHETHAREAIAAAIEVVKRLLPGLSRREALAEVEALIAECFARLHDEPRLVIRVADEMLDPLRQRVDQLAAAAGFSGRVILLADSALAETDARIEWADGGVDRDLGAVWREIESTIKRFIDDGPGAASAGRK